MTERKITAHEWAREAIKMANTEFISITKAEYDRLKRLNENVNNEIESLKASIPSLKLHQALDEVHHKIDYLESLYK